MSENLSQAMEIVKVCGQDSPPYAYMQRDKSGKPTGELRGAIIDLLSEVSHHSNFEFDIWLGPWKRCEFDVINYNNKNGFEMALNATSNRRRENLFQKSALLFKTTEGLFYSKKQYPKGITNPSFQTIQDRKFCGVRGNNATWIKALNLNIKLDYNSTTLALAMKQLSLERCSFIAYSIEFFLGEIRTGKLTIENDIAYVAFPGNRQPEFHIWVSKSSPRRSEILEAIDSEVSRLKGEKYEALFQTYDIRGSGLDSN
ncbi:MAG: hypothetical protein JKX94_12690 [Sneathiella sp.]|nr:hypothetical protein [Sneathiella sp.]